MSYGKLPTIESSDRLRKHVIMWFSTEIWDHAMFTVPGIQSISITSTTELHINVTRIKEMITN